MKTKMCILIIGLGVLLIFSYFFHHQAELMQKNYSENCITQTKTLAHLCKEAIAGFDFDLLNNTLSKFCQQTQVVKAIITEDPGQTILVSTTEGENGKIFRQDHISERVFKAYAPISVAQKKWTLILLFDQSPVIEKQNALKRKMLFQGLLIFIAGTILILILEKMIARSRSSEPLKEGYDHRVDVFALPDLHHDTQLMLKTSMNRQGISPDEKQIIKIVHKEKQIAHILKQCQMDELLAFELISGLVAQGILSPHPSTSSGGREMREMETAR